MKIVLNTKNADLINYFMRIAKSYKGPSVEIKASRVENGFFESISDPAIDLYLINVPCSYSQKAVDLIKRKTPYIPVILFGPINILQDVSGADIYLPYCDQEPYSEVVMKKFLELAIRNANNFLKNFATLRKLTTKMANIIDFGQCKYDPTRRTLLFRGKQVKKLSAKEGGILEVLAANFGEVVKKEIILEKVWHKSDYFSGRSMDVYITHLRHLFKENEIDMTIKNISGVGLILE
jgi:DNA-binding winged helix-turn-helix (wHTH) protein